MNTYITIYFKHIKPRTKLSSYIFKIILIYWNKYVFQLISRWYLETCRYEYYKSFESFIFPALCKMVVGARWRVSRRKLVNSVTLSRNIPWDDCLNNNVIDFLRRLLNDLIKL